MRCTALRFTIAWLTANWRSHRGDSRKRSSSLRSGGRCILASLVDLRKRWSRSEYRRSRHYSTIFSTRRQAGGLAVNGQFPTSARGGEIARRMQTNTPLFLKRLREAFSPRKRRRNARACPQNVGSVPRHGEYTFWIARLGSERLDDVKNMFERRIESGQTPSTPMTPPVPAPSRSFFTGAYSGESQNPRAASLAVELYYDPPSTVIFPFEQLDLAPSHEEPPSVMRDHRRDRLPVHRVPVRVEYFGLNQKVICHSCRPFSTGCDCVSVPSRAHGHPAV